MSLEQLYCKLFKKGLVCDYLIETAKDMEINIKNMKTRLRNISYKLNDKVEFIRNIEDYEVKNTTGTIKTIDTSSRMIGVLCDKDLKKTGTNLDNKIKNLNGIWAYERDLYKLL